MFDMIISSTHVFTILYAYCWHAEWHSKYDFIQVLDMYVRLVDTFILLRHGEHIAIKIAEMLRESK